MHVHNYTVPFVHLDHTCACELELTYMFVFRSKNHDTDNSIKRGMKRR